MFFLGTTFLSNGNTMNATPTNVANIGFVKVQNGVYDEMYTSKGVDYEYTTEIPTEWNYDTVFHALFDGNLNAGNVNFTASQVSAIRIKRREKGTFKWLTLFEKPIEDAEDFNFEFLDFYNRHGVDYEYAVVPIINSVEGSFKINEVHSDFTGIFVIEKDRVFHTDFETDITSIQRNQSVASIITIGRRYPFHIKNALTNYDSGTVQGFFVELDKYCNLKIKEGFDYRKEFMDFLTNGNPKILKSGDGRIWLIEVVGSPSESTKGHPDLVITSFQWEETGHYESSTDLYDANLIDVNVEGS